VQGAPSPLQAAEMVLVRLAYVAELPAPGDVVKQIAEGGGPSAAVSPPSSPGNGAAPRSAPSFAEARPAARTAPSSAPSVESAGGATLALAPSPAETAPGPATPALARPQSFLEVIELFDRNREAVLRSNLYSNVHLVRFEPGRIEFRPTAGAPPNLANRLGQLLGEWTGARWVVTVSREEGQPTLREQAELRLAVLRSEAAEHPLVRAVLETFPGATIEAVRELTEAAPDADGAEPGEANEGDEAS
jgi:DNA polymerase III subunit gamma/tau